MKHHVISICAIFAMSTLLFGTDVYQLNLAEGKALFDGKKIFGKIDITRSESMPYLTIQPERANPLQVAKMSPDEFEAMKKGNFTFQSRLRVNGRNGHLYVFALGAGAGHEGIRIGLEVRDGKIIPYVNINFTKDNQEMQRFSLACRKNSLLPGEWFNYSVSFDRSGEVVLRLNGDVCGSVNISEFASSELLCFRTVTAQIYSETTGGFMQYRPLKLEAPYDASLDIAVMNLKTGLVDSVQFLNEKKP